VTNHALLLSALSIGESDNGQPLIAPPSDMLLVLDEGHHIGNVAIDQGAASLALDEMAKRTGRLQVLIAASYRAVDKDKLGNLLPNEAIEAAAKVSKQLKAFRDVIDRSWRPD
ncbi:ATP-dependent DNA helicase DinG, partial [Mycobacterium tuberculosis]